MLVVVNVTLNLMTTNCQPIQPDLGVGSKDLTFVLKYIPLHLALDPTPKSVSENTYKWFYSAIINVY